MNFWRHRTPISTPKQKSGRLATSELDSNRKLRISLDERRVLAARRKLLNAVQTVGIIAVPLLTLGLLLWNGHQQSKRESAELMIRFNQLLNSGGSKFIVRELNLHGDLSQIRISGDKLDDAIDDFLTDYELLNTANESKLIDHDMAAGAFGYNLGKALEDPTIWEFIRDSRLEKADIWNGVFKLARSFGIKISPPITPSTAVP